MTIDELAQEIRRVDGNHSLGAGALAEALMPFIASLPDREPRLPDRAIEPLREQILNLARFGVDGDLVSLACVLESVDSVALSVAGERVAAGDPLQHGRNCPANVPLHDEDCTCGLKWRIQLQTEQEMHNAWRKRAEQAEREMVPMRSALEFIVQQENLTFAECSLAEEIVSRAKAALAIPSAAQEEK